MRICQTLKLLFLPMLFLGRVVKFTLFWISSLKWITQILIFHWAQCLILTRHTEIYLKCWGLQSEAWFQTKVLDLLWVVWENVQLFEQWDHCWGHFFEHLFFGIAFRIYGPFFQTAIVVEKYLSLDLILEIAKINVINQINNQLGYISYVLLDVKLPPNSAA